MGIRRLYVLDYSQNYRGASVKVARKNISNSVSTLDSRETLYYIYLDRYYFPFFFFGGGPAREVRDFFRAPLFFAVTFFFADGATFIRVDVGTFTAGSSFSTFINRSTDQPIVTAVTASPGFSSTKRMPRLAVRLRRGASSSLWDLDELLEVCRVTDQLPLPLASPASFTRLGRTQARTPLP